jgi:hypothetical protein
MAWPGHIKPGEVDSALTLQDAILTTCEQRLAAGGLTAQEIEYYELIHAHARLDKANHAHGRLRTLVTVNGAGVHGPADLDTAWDDVRRAHDHVVPLVAPTLADLAIGLDGIEHGGGGLPPM